MTEKAVRSKAGGDLPGTERARRLNVDDPDTAHDLEIVVVTYRSAATIEDCLDSLAPDRIPGLRTLVHVVDNGSPDETVGLLARRYPWVDLTCMPGNAGFAAANNAVLRDVTAPWVLVLNPDTVVPGEVIQRLIATGQDDDRIGVLGCRLVQGDGTFDHASKRSFPTVRNALSYFMRPGKGASAYLAPDVDERGSGPVDAVNGAFMLIRVDAMREVGLLDERFWMYGEDLDWCRRFSDAGWRVHYDGTVSATHLKGASSGRRRPWRLNWHFHRSMILYYDKHESGGSVLTDVVVRAGIVAKFLASASRNAAASWWWR